MTALIITYIIGTDNVGIGEDGIGSVEGYRAEVEERLIERFPEAKYVDVVIENGSSKARVEGLDWETKGDQQESMIEAVNAIADEVWNHGNWHNVSVVNHKIRIPILTSNSKTKAEALEVPNG